MKVKIHKLIIYPICSILSDDDRLIEEKRMKAIPFYVYNIDDLPRIISKLEEKVNEEYLSKFEKAKSPGLEEITGDSKGI